MQIHPHRSIKIGDRFYTKGEERDFLDALAGNDTQVICRRLLAYESSGALILREDTLEAVEDAASGGANEVVEELSAEAQESAHIDSGRSLLDMLGKAETEQDRTRSDGSEQPDPGGEADESDFEEGGDEPPADSGSADEQSSEDSGSESEQWNAEDALVEKLTTKELDLLAGTKYNTVESIENASQDDLEEIDGIGPATAKSILQIEDEE